MLYNQRIIWKDGATLRDISRELNDAFEATTVIDLQIAPTDYLYIGSDLPFNHRFVDVASANAVAASFTIEVWDGNAWVAVVDVVDQTKAAGGAATLAESGILSWTLNRDESWTFEDSTEDMDASGLETLRIYSMYWTRLAVSAPLTGTTALRYLGHKFADDADLGAMYPDLIRSDVLTAFQAGKTNWIPQHIVAAEEIIRELRKARIIWGASQLMAWEQFSAAAVHKVAEIVFASFGDAYEKQRMIALGKYKREIDQGVFIVDRNENGRIDKSERRMNAGLVRT